MNFLLITTTLLFCISVSAIPGWDDYLHVDLSGSLNIILSAPHGGTIKTFDPPIPDRRHGCYIDNECVYSHTCGEPDEDHCEVKISSDFKTDDMAHRVYKEIHKLTGEYPKIVVNNIHRCKLDPNRPEDAATFGQTVPTVVYNWFYGNISHGIALSNDAPVFVADLHGYSDEDVTATLLGYAVSRYNLNNLNDSELDVIWYSSSIRHLAAREEPDISFSNLIRGYASFGQALKNTANGGVDAIPSPQIPNPGSGKYFTGGHITRTFGHFADAIQVEIHYSDRTPLKNRKAYAKKLAKAIVDFCKTYFIISK